MTGHPFLKGIGLGMMAGAAVGATMMKNEKNLKQAAQKTVKQVGKLAEDAAHNVAGTINEMRG